MNPEQLKARVRPERTGYQKIIHQQHVERIKGMKPTVDCGPPRPHPLSNKGVMDKVNFLYFKLPYFKIIKIIIAGYYDYNTIETTFRSH